MGVRRIRTIHMYVIQHVNITNMTDNALDFDMHTYTMK